MSDTNPTGKAVQPRDCEFCLQPLTEVGYGIGCSPYDSELVPLFSCKNEICQRARTAVFEAKNSSRIFGKQVAYGAAAQMLRRHIRDGGDADGFIRILLMKRKQNADLYKVIMRVPWNADTVKRAVHIKDEDGQNE